MTVLSLLSLVVAGAAPVQTPRLWLTWDAPDTQACPSREEVVEETRRLRGTLELAASAEGADVIATARAALVPDTQQWVIELETVAADTKGHRRLEADGCQRAAEALAVVLSLALDERAEHAQLDVGPEPSPLHFLVGPTVEGLVGVWPSVTSTFGASVGLAWRRLRVELVLGSAPIEGVEFGALVPTRVSLPFLSQVRGCGLVLTGRLELDLCLELPVGVVAARGLDDSAGATGPWAAVWGSSAVRWGLTDWLWLKAGGGAGVAFVRPQLETTSGVYYVVPLGCGYGALTVELRL